jgi:hypothetical protein
MPRRRYFVLSAMCPSLFTDENETFTTYDDFFESDIFTVSKRSHEQNARFFEEGTL